MKVGDEVRVNGEKEIYTVLRVGSVFGTPVAWLRGYGFYGTGFVELDNLIVCEIVKALC